MGLLDPATSDGRVIFFLPWEGKLNFCNWIVGKVTLLLLFITEIHVGEKGRVERNFVLLVNSGTHQKNSGK